MKLLLQSAMIFFGTLMTAAVVAWGEPADGGLAMTARMAPQSRASGLRHQVDNNHPWTERVSGRASFGQR